MKKIFLLMCLVLAAIQVRAGDLKIRFPVEKFKLDNGLTVILHEDHNVPMISYHTWYRVGSRDEQPGVTGAAHMLEHMMFKGAKKYSGKEFDQLLHANGITNNAFTSWDYTGFYQNLPSSKLEMMMDMEVDRMRYLALKPEDLKSELQVVGEERRWRVDNNPMGLLREALFSVAYTNSPYHWPVIGYMKDIQDYTSEKLKYFYDKFYVPNNAVLVLAGDFDTKKTKMLIEKYYGQLKAAPLLDRKYDRDPMPSKSVKKVVESDVQNTTLMIAYPGVEAGHVDSYALDLLSSILGQGNSSRLYKKLVYEDQLATSAESHNLTNADPGLILFSASLKPSTDENQGLNGIRNEIKKIIQLSLSEKELEKSKNQLIKNLVDDLTTIDGKAQALAVNEILFGSYEKLFSDLEKYKQVTIQDIETVAKKYLNSHREILTILRPKSQVAKKSE